MNGYVSTDGHQAQRLSEAFLDGAGVSPQAARRGDERAPPRQPPPLAPLPSVVLSRAAEPRQEHRPAAVDHRPQSESVDAVPRGARQIRMGLDQRRESESALELSQDERRELEVAAADHRSDQGGRPGHRAQAASTRAQECQHDRFVHA